ncbi:MAG: lipopolysaccharide biosynthesis protein [Hyphomicrobiales bacterium]|nr:lipopolysaccharide biosynthesis protein [Hyphomicrobiales bacterium]
MKVLAAFVVNALFNFVIGLIVAKFLGPEEYGRFALALALGLVIQTAIFDWIRLSAIRFYSERTRRDEPQVRATLDTAFAILAVGLTLVVAMLMLSNVKFGLSHALIGLSLATAVTNGLFDYSCGLARARFDDHQYGRLVLVKNALSLVLTTGAAFWFCSAKMALLGAIVSIAGSIVAARGALTDAKSEPRRASFDLGRSYLAYALPIIAANLLYLLIPFVNRALVAKYYGFAETGQFSLAFDLGLRAVQAIGSALDVLLFQLAVAAHETHGLDRAKDQIARNITIVLAVIAPACAGVLMTLPSVEALLVPAEFRGPFGHYLTLMMPGLFALTLINFAINPIFQIEKRTLPLIGAALIGCAGTPLLVWLLPHGDDASSLATAQSIAYVAALLALVCFAISSRPRWPSIADLARIALSLAGMAAVVLPMRHWQPGVVSLGAQVISGALTYGALALALDIGGLRAPLVGKLREFLRRRDEAAEAVGER